MHSVFVAAAAVVALLSACGSAAPLPDVAGGAQLGVKRGGAWTTMKLKRPNLIGPTANLKLADGELNGSISGRPLHVTIEKDGAYGTGPFGPIELRVIDRPQDTEVSGTWNGARVFFRVTPESLRGSIPVFAGAQVSSVQTCEYVLDRVEPDGARVGVSTCAALPQRTRLELPASVTTSLGASELAVVTLALLTSAPTER